MIYLTDDYSHFHVQSSEESKTISLEESEEEIDKLRCVKVSPDGTHVACGDGDGNIKIYDLESSELISDKRCHDQEVTCLGYSPFVSEEGGYVLASGSRDRMIHVYDSSEGYDAVNSLEGHSGSIHDLSFAFDPEEIEFNKRLKLLSCGADKTIIYRGVENSRNIDNYHKEVIKNNKFSSMSINGNKVTVGLDKLTAVYDISSYSKLYEKKPELTKTTGQLNYTQVLLDKSGTFLISSCSDKTFSIQDTLVGTQVTKGSFGEKVTSLQLSCDNRYLITTSVEGNIYFWRLNEQITKCINQRLNILELKVPSLSNPPELDLKMPPLITPAKPTRRVIPKKSEGEDWDKRSGKLPFAGKNPGEILFKMNKERKAQQVEESKTPTDPKELSESQFVRHEKANELNDMVGNIANDI